MLFAKSVKSQPLGMGYHLVMLLTWCLLCVCNISHYIWPNDPRIPCFHCFQGGHAASAEAEKYGLVSARDLADKAARVREENERKRLTAAGREATTVYRDRATGRTMTEEEWAESRKK